MKIAEIRYRIKEQNKFLYIELNDILLHATSAATILFFYCGVRHLSLIIIIICAVWLKYMKLINAYLRMYICERQIIQLSFIVAIGRWCLFVLTRCNHVI